MIGIPIADEAMTDVLKQSRRALEGERVRLRELRGDDLPRLVRRWLFSTTTFSPVRTHRLPR